MAKYSINGKNHKVNFDELSFEIIEHNETSVTLNWKFTDDAEGFGPRLEDLFKHDRELKDYAIPCFGLYLNFKIEKGPKPVVDCLSYEKSPYGNKEVKIVLTAKEKKKFQSLLDNDEILKDTFSLDTVKNELEEKVTTTLCNAVSADYAETILYHYDDESEQTVLDAIVEDVIVSSAWETTGEYNEDDIRLAIGRELAAQLGE